MASLLRGINNNILVQLNFGRVQDSLPYIQARMLAAVGMCQSQLPSHIKCGHVALSLVCNSCLQLQVLDEDDEIGSYQQGQTVEQVWLAWRFRETRRRTGLFIWVGVPQNSHWRPYPGVTDASLAHGQLPRVCHRTPPEHASQELTTSCSQQGRPMGG